MPHEPPALSVRLHEPDHHMVEVGVRKAGRADQVCRRSDSRASSLALQVETRELNGAEALEPLGVELATPSLERR
jgi:hypothetical protein